MNHLEPEHSYKGTGIMIYIFLYTNRGKEKKKYISNCVNICFYRIKTARQNNFASTTHINIMKNYFSGFTMKTNPKIGTYTPVYVQDWL